MEKNNKNRKKERKKEKKTELQPGAWALSFE